MAGRRHNVPRLKQEVVMELLPLSKCSANQAHGNNVCSPQFRGKLDSEVKIERSQDKGRISFLVSSTSTVYFGGGGGGGGGGRCERDEERGVRGWG